MKDYLKSITPDSFSGLVFAFEGIKKSVTLINGPTGCKFYHSAVSDAQTLKQYEFDPLRFPLEWYFGQPRVPCTYLDSKDYVYGSKDKLQSFMDFIKDSNSVELICIVNSPGAALIGDDIGNIVRDCGCGAEIITAESPGYSENICSGYEKGSLKLIEKIAPAEKKQTLPKSVNILGLSVFHKNFKGDKEELARLLALCGITVGCFLCADCTAEEIKNLSQAELNIVIHPEYGSTAAQHLKKKYGTPYYICSGAPVGFEASENFISDVCSLLGADCSAFTEESEKARALAYVHVSRVNSLTGLPKGVSTAVAGSYSELYSYCRFLIEYFGLMISSAAVTDEENDIFRSETEELLAEYGMEDALRAEISDTGAELVFADGNTIARLKLRKHQFSGIEIALPGMGYLDVTEKTHLGLKGALMLTELVLNALMF